VISVSSAFDMYGRSRWWSVISHFVVLTFYV